MPYLPQHKREELEARLPVEGAELNYVITRHVTRLMSYFERTRGPMRYADYAEILAALEGAKHEFQRLHMDPYEDRKREENGPV